LGDLPFLWAALAAGFALSFSSRRYHAPSPSLSKRRRRLRRRRLCQALWAATTRSLTLFLLGLFLNNGRDLGRWRVTGPLQSLAFALWVVSVTSTVLQHFYYPPPALDGAFGVCLK
jgi:hypothetical protein